LIIPFLFMMLISLSRSSFINVMQMKLQLSTC